MDTEKNLHLCRWRECQYLKWTFELPRISGHMVNKKLEGTWTLRHKKILWKKKLCQANISLCYNLFKKNSLVSKGFFRIIPANRSWDNLKNEREIEDPGRTYYAACLFFREKVIRNVIEISYWRERQVLKATIIE